MKTITIEQLEGLNQNDITVIDVRSNKDYSKNTIDGAINMPLDEFDASNLSNVDKSKPVYVLCYTGDKSVSAVEALSELGYDAYNVEGGYRSYLRLYLQRVLAKDEEIKEKTAEIERSIIKKFRKNVWCKFTRAINEYDMLQEGDKVAVCISGGKDSMLMAKLFQEIQRHGKFHFELVFLCMNPGYNADNWKIIQDNARLLGIPLTAFESDIFNIVADVDKNPCYLCARMRRGYLYSQAQALGCNKIALGHHFDDVIETTLMGMLYSGKIETMMPKLHSTNFEGMELIRPLYLIKEEAIKAWRDYNRLNFIQCACRFTENCVSCGGGQGSKRDEMKRLVEQFRQTSPLIEGNIFKSVHNVNLGKVIGYTKDGVDHSFLENYNNYNNGEK
jgi:tRNA(Ile)-lysidine synthase TilS/MesJ/rhodanese-related sulfurtransferase